MTTTPIAAGPNDVTVRALPCPFCGHAIDLDGEDTLYPSGTGWKFDEELQMRTYHRATSVPPDQWCWGMHCAETYGGCGAEVHGDSKEDVLAKWNTRSNAIGQGSAACGTSKRSGLIGELYMNTFNGMKIVESPLIAEVPKLQLSHDFTACSDAMKKHMNDWLREMFGTYLPCYVIGGDTIAMHPKHVAMLRMQNDMYNAELKGGA